MIKYVILFVGLLWGCTQSPSNGDKPIRIVCTTGMIADAVTEMTQGNCQVDALMGPGTDPHLFKATKGSLDLLAAADIVVANGLHLEGRMQDILHKLGRQKTVLFVGDYVDQDRLLYGDKSEKMPDPHIWFDVAYWKSGLAGVAQRLDEKGVLNAEASKAYLSQLDTLDTWVRTTIHSIPKEDRVLVTAHDAFSYFGRAYDIEVVGLQGISTVAEYGIRDVTRMVDMISDRNIKAVFVESSISSRSIEAVIAGCERRNHHVKLGGTLYSDAPGPRDSDAETYIGMVRHNVLTMKNALQ